MWDRPAALDICANALFALACAGVAWGALVWAVQRPAFALRTARVETPLGHVTPDQIEAVVARDGGGGFFTVDLERLQADFEKLPWVRSAVVRRVWPAGLAVTLEEHEPLARWGDSALVDTRGEVFAAAYDGELPRLSGPDARAQEVALRYTELRARLAAIGAVPEAVELSERGAWSLRLAGGTLIELGREHVDERLGRYLAVYARTVGALPASPAYVDLRYPNGFAVRAPDKRADAQDSKASMDQNA